MSKSSLRRDRRKLTAELIAEGKHTRRSNYTTSDIRDVVQTTIGDMRAMMEAHRDRLNDRSWAHRAKSKKDTAPVIHRDPSSLINVRAELDDAVATGLHAIVRSCRAFAHIRAERLYLSAGYKTFDEYCRARWGFSADFVDEQIRTAETSRV